MFKKSQPTTGDPWQLWTPSQTRIDTGLGACEVSPSIKDEKIGDLLHANKISES